MWVGSWWREGKERGEESVLEERGEERGRKERAGEESEGKRSEYISE